MGYIKRTLLVCNYCFALNTGAYTSEILRSAFQTIKPGVIEAGKSLGISNKIIFYQNSDTNSNKTIFTCLW